MAMHVKKGDVVMVIAGNDRGVTGEVLSVSMSTGRIVVQGVNRAYRHLRPSKQHPQGGRIRKEMPIHISNVQPIDPKTSQPTRVGFRLAENNSKERFAQKSGQSLGTVKKAK